MFQGLGSLHKRCTCPMWVEGTANGTYLRRSLKTASWERVTELSRIIEESDKPNETLEREDQPVTIVHAVTEYLADAKARELAEATLYKLKIQLENNSSVGAKLRDTSSSRNLI